MTEILNHKNVQFGWGEAVFPMVFPGIGTILHKWNLWRFKRFLKKRGYNKKYRFSFAKVHMDPESINSITVIGESDLSGELITLKEIGKFKGQPIYFATPQEYDAKLANQEREQ